MQSADRVAQLVGARPNAQNTVSSEVSETRRQSEGQIFKSRVTRATSDMQVIRMRLHRKSPQTVRVYSNDIKAFFSFTGCTLAEVRLEDVQAFADEIAEELSPSSQARRLAAVRSLLGFANRIGYFPFNVGAAVELPKPENRLSERILSESEVQRIIRATSNDRDRALLHLLYGAGLRVSEAASLSWRQLQPHKDAGVVTVHGKGSKTRSVLLSSDCWKAVSRLRRGGSDSVPVFLSQKGGGLSGSQIYRIVQDAADRRASKRMSRRTGCGMLTPHMRSTEGLRCTWSRTRSVMLRWRRRRAPRSGDRAYEPYHLFHWLEEAAQRDPTATIEIMELIAEKAEDLWPHGLWSTEPLVSALAELLREADEADDPALVSRTIRIQDRYLRLNVKGMDELLSRAARPT